MLNVKCNSLNFRKFFISERRGAERKGIYDIKNLCNSALNDNKRKLLKNKHQKRRIHENRRNIEQGGRPERGCRP